MPAGVSLDSITQWKMESRCQGVLLSNIMVDLIGISHMWVVCVFVCLCLCMCVRVCPLNIRISFVCVFSSDSPPSAVVIIPGPIALLAHCSYVR